VEDVYRTVPTGHDFGVGSSYAAGTSSAGVAHDDDDPDLGLNLDSMMDVLTQLEDAPNPTQPSQALQGGRARNPLHHFTPRSSAVIHRKCGHRH
jgi:hypothetical protein